MQATAVRLPVLNTYLRQQRELTLVERFAERHENHEIAPGTARYSELIPLERPKSGQQYAFEVDLDACTGCKACVAACHRLNGLDGEAAETWRSVGLLHGGTPEAPVQQTVSTACHHCMDPACMKGCPVNAYEKDPQTGIVRHLDDQCIGCQYCTLTCPYEVPQFNSKRGIVRKCDMCSDRLAEGEAPACVQACPNEAIKIRIVDTLRVLEDAQSDQFLPAAPSPGITVPTTRYVTKRALPRNLLPADFYSVRSSAQHLPLVIMLVLTQLAVGAFSVDYVMNQLSSSWLSQARTFHAIVSVVLAVVALVASVFHLGRPQYAFRAVLGFKTSWLSREIVAFGGFVKLALLYAGLLVVQSKGLLPAPWAAVASRALPFVGGSLVAIGCLGVFCSAMVYGVTNRRWWAVGRSSFRFFASATVLGLATSLLTLVWAHAGGVADREAARVVGVLSWALALASSSKLLWELSVLTHLRDKRLGEIKRTALLMSGPLLKQSLGRFGLGLLGGILLPSLVVSLMALGSVTTPVIALTSLLWVLVLAAELGERSLFFSAVSVPRMPGAVGS
jgi:Fe-S-cluster-containing dehydrogenase component/DMSO reductase anchor subunit